MDLARVLTSPPVTGSAAAAIHQHQRLALIDAGVANGFSLPAAGVNQPARSEFDRTVSEEVLNDFWLALDDVCALLGRDGGVLEKTADVADDGRVGQLGLADLANPLINL